MNHPARAREEDAGPFAAAAGGAIEDRSAAGGAVEEVAGTGTGLVRKVGLMADGRRITYYWLPDRGVRS
jgi:hypothetical protein